MVKIKLAGKEIPLHFGMHVAQHMAPLFAEDADAIDKSAILINLAHENYLKVDRKAEKVIDEGEAYAAIEEAIIVGDTVTNDAVAKVWQDFTASALMKSLLQKGSEIVNEEAKKKVAPGKKSKSLPSA